jgi:cystathionine beta-lyase
MYNFDQITDRHGTDSVKWDGMEEMFGRNDLTPMWVADMDFLTPAFILDAISKRLDRRIMGYTTQPDEWKTTICSWQEKKHGWIIDKEHLGFIPGIVRGIAFALQALTEKGDKVMVMSPVYHPFFLVAEHNGRQVVRNTLKLNDGQYEIDFARFEEDVKGCKVFILSNPHNPGGRVWTKDELTKIADICHANGTIVISDEIHADLTFAPYKHIPFATVSDKAREISVIFGSPSKAFNTPGIITSYSVVPNDSLRRRFYSYLEASELNCGNMFAYITAIAAYRYGEQWLEELKCYLQKNIDLVEKHLKKHCPQISMIRPQASYLIFLDCRKLQLEQDELERLFTDKIGIALNTGTMFGEEGKGFMRMNIGTQREQVLKSLEKISREVNRL